VRDGETGALCAVGDVEAMSAAAIRLLTDDALWRSTSARAAADARARFSLEQVVAQYEAFYVDALGGSLSADDE
jgi:L-malate glycosyltransferase